MSCAEEAAGDDGSVGGDREPFNLPHPGEEDKTDMPGEPEPGDPCQPAQHETLSSPHHPLPQRVTLGGTAL